MDLLEIFFKIVNWKRIILPSHSLAWVALHSHQNKNPKTLSYSILKAYQKIFDHLVWKFDGLWPVCLSTSPSAMPPGQHAHFAQTNSDVQVSSISPSNITPLNPSEVISKVSAILQPNRAVHTVSSDQFIPPQTSIT